MMRAQLRLKEQVYEDRKERLRKILDVGEPKILIHTNARLLAECFEYTWRDKLHRWWMVACPHWVRWITSKAYRAACLEDSWRM